MKARGIAVDNARTLCMMLALYGAIHALIARAAGPSLALDDVKLNVLTQSFEWGYLPENPPLFEWLLGLAQSALGPSLPSFLVVKYAALIIAGFAVFGSARAAGAGASAAALAAASMLATYQIGAAWHETLTHSALAFTASAGFLWAMMRHMAAPSLSAAAVAGAVAGIGVLSKYSFAPAATALLIAMAMTPQARRAVHPRYLAVIFALALAVAAPHLIWKLGAEFDPAPGVVKASRVLGARLMEDFPSALWAVAAFAAPLALYRRLAGPVAIPGGLSASVAIRALGVGAAMLSAAALGGFGEIDERYAAPFMAPAFVVLALTLGDAAVRRRLVWIVGAVVAAIGAVRIAALAVAGPPFCENCRQYIDYAPLAHAIGPGANATIVGFDDHIAGNLRRLYPHARVLSAHMPFYVPPGGRAGDRCLFAWSPDFEVAPPEAVTQASAMQVSLAAPRMRSFSRPGAVVNFRIADFTADGTYSASLCRLPAR